MRIVDGLRVKCRAGDETLALMICNCVAGVRRLGSGFARLWNRVREPIVIVRRSPEIVGCDEASQIEQTNGRRRAEEPAEDLARTDAATKRIRGRYRQRQQQDDGYHPADALRPRRVMVAFVFDAVVIDWRKDEYELERDKEFQITQTHKRSNQYDLHCYHNKTVALRTRTVACHLDTA